MKNYITNKRLIDLSVRDRYSIKFIKNSINFKKNKIYSYFSFTSTLNSTNVTNIDVNNSNDINKNLNFLNIDYTRHTVNKKRDTQVLYTPRENGVDAIKKFSESVLPKLEYFVELRLLEDLKDQLTPLEKEEIQDAFNLRRYKAENTHKLTNISDALEADKDEDNEEYIEHNTNNLIASFNGLGFNKLNYKDIGKYIAFPEKIKNNYFPTGFYGEYINYEYRFSKKISLMVREESLNIQNYLHFKKTESERKPFIHNIINKLETSFLNNTNFSLIDLIKKNFLYYSIFYQEISDSILDIINIPNYYKKYQLLDFLSSPDIHDGIIDQIINNLSDNNFALLFVCFKEIRIDVLNQILLFFKEKFASKINLKNSQLNQLDHRVSEDDIINFQFFSQIQRNNNYLPIKYNIDFIKDLLTNRYKDKDNINNLTELFINQISTGKNLYLKHNKIFPNDIIPSLNKHKIDYLKNIKEYNDSQKLSDKEIERRNNRPGCYEDIFDEFYIDNPFDLKNTYTGYRGFNSGIVLYGESGSGKSCILAHLHAYAKENNWFVIPVYRASRFTKDKEKIEQHLNGLYLQNKQTKELLIDIKLSNIDYLKSYKNNKLIATYYGKYNSSGMHEDAPYPVPTLWDDKRQVFTDSWKIFHEDETDSIAKFYPYQFKKMSDYLTNPRDLLEIVNYGIDNPEYSTNALGELLGLISKDKNLKTMMLIDEYNEFFLPTDYQSFKYANWHDGRIPAYALATVRMLMSMNGHLNYNMFKVFGLSQGRYYRHSCSPDMLNLSMNFTYEISNLRLNDLRKAIQYYSLIPNFLYEILSEQSVLNAFTISQGNWKELLKHVRSVPMAVTSHKAYIERKAVNIAIREKNMEIKKELKLKAKVKALKIRHKVEKSREKMDKYSYYI